MTCVVRSPLLHCCLVAFCLDWRSPLTVIVLAPAVIGAGESAESACGTLVHVTSSRCYRRAVAVAVLAVNCSLRFI